MEFRWPDASVTDKRVRRSRAALMHAAIALVSERGTAAVSISDIAEAADVSRPVLYQHFGDRDTLLLETALDLAARELLPRITDTTDTSSTDTSAATPPPAAPSSPSSPSGLCLLGLVCIS